MKKKTSIKHLIVALVLFLGIGSVCWWYLQGANDVFMTRKTIGGSHIGALCLAISPDGVLVVAAGSSRCVTAWDLTSGRIRFEFMAHEDLINGVCFSPDGKHFGTASDDGTVKVWDTSTCREIVCLKHDSRVLALVFSSDGRFLFSGTSGEQISQWDWAREQVTNVVTSNANVQVLAISPDGTLIASGMRDGSIRTWQAGRLVGSGVLVGTMSSVETLSFSPDSRMLAIGDSSNNVMIWNLESGNMIGSLTMNCIVASLRFSSDGRFLFVGCRHTLTVLETETFDEVQVTRFRQLGNLGSLGFLRDMRIAPDGGVVMIFAFGPIQVWHLKQ